MSSFFPDVPFAEVFPEVRSFLIEHKHTETRIEPKGVRKGVMMERNGNKTLPCNWHRCKHGGFVIQQAIFSPMVSKRETRASRMLECCGHEVLDNRMETAIEKGTTSAVEKGASRQLKREPPEAKLPSIGLSGDFCLPSNRSEGLTGARHGRFRTDPADGAG